MIGIDSRPHSLRLVALSRRCGQWRLQACSQQTLPAGYASDVSAHAAAVRTLIAGLPGRLRRGRPAVAMALPLGEVNLQMRDLPSGASAQDAAFIANMEAETQGAALAMDFRVLPQQAQQTHKDLMIVSCPQSSVEDRVVLMEAAGCRLVSLAPDALVLADCYAGQSCAEVLLIDVGDAAVRLTGLRNSVPVYWRHHDVDVGAVSAATVLTRALQQYRISAMLNEPDRLLLCGADAVLPEVQQVVARMSSQSPQLINPFLHLGFAAASVPASVPALAPAFAMAFALAAQELP